MFIRSLYAIKDVKSGFSDPCVQVNDAVAARSFERQVPHMADELGIPVSDFQLWRVGQFDVDAGMLVSDTPVLLLDGASLFRKDDFCETPACSCSESE